MTNTNKYNCATMNIGHLSGMVWQIWLPELKCTTTERHWKGKQLYTKNSSIVSSSWGRGRDSKGQAWKRSINTNWQSGRYERLARLSNTRSSKHQIFQAISPNKICILKYFYRTLQKPSVGQKLNRKSCRKTKWKGRHWRYHVAQLALTCKTADNSYWWRNYHCLFLLSLLSSQASANKSLSNTSLWSDLLESD